MILAHDSVVWLSHTTNNDYFDPGDSMIVPKYLYATDITGDGIPDLLVSDGVHIWIFRGGGLARVLSAHEEPCVLCDSQSPHRRSSKRAARRRPCSISVSICTLVAI